MAYGAFENIIGVGNIFDVTPAPTNLKDLPFIPGTMARATDVVWGQGDFIFARAGAGIRIWGVCVLTPVWDSTNFVFTQNMTEAPNTANLGRAVYVYQGDTALTTGQYGWFMRRGVTPVNCSTTVAADTTFGITAAGQAGTNAAGKQLLNARVMAAGSLTVAKTGVGASGDNVIYIPSGTQGFFSGGYMSGTGVGSSAIVQKVFPDRLVVSVVNSAAISSTVTQTNNNGTIYLNIAALNDAFAQGAIT
jgi:hypothetical protein